MNPPGVTSRPAVVQYMMKPLMTKKMSTPAPSQWPEYLPA